MTPDPETGKEGYLKLWFELDTNTLVSKVINDFFKISGPGHDFLPIKIGSSSFFEL